MPGWRLEEQRVDENGGEIAERAGLPAHLADASGERGEEGSPHRPDEDEGLAGKEIGESDRAECEAGRRVQGTRVALAPVEQGTRDERSRRDQQREAAPVGLEHRSVEDDGLEEYRA